MIIKNKQTHKQKTPKSNKNVKEKDPIKRKRQKNQIRSLESIRNAQNKKPHLRLINPICLGPF